MPNRSPRPLFVVGCPRSGTTWVQLLLARHPLIATAPETHIFSFYLAGFKRQWEHENAETGRGGQGKAGLSRLLTEADFEELCRRSAAMVLERIAAGRPGAEIIVEKSPQHAVHARFINRILPEARFLHVIRDPRDTAASLLAAGRGWGSNWAPRNAIDAARMWVRHVEGAREVAGPGTDYREIRYEALQQDAVGELRGLLEWLELPVDEESCAEAVRACELSQLRKPSNAAKPLPLPGDRSPAGFFRKGKVGGWREDLTAGEVRVVEHLCARWMSELGYVPEREATSRPVRIRLHDSLRRVRESLDWQLQRLLYRV